jgi:hypothetical protein
LLGDCGSAPSGAAAERAGELMDEMRSSRARRSASSSSVLRAGKEGGASG